MLPNLKPQEIPLDHSDSCNMYVPSSEKPFVETTRAIEMYSEQVIFASLSVLQVKARNHGGLDYLQVFESDKPENLWFIEDPPGGAITAGGRSLEMRRLARVGRFHRRQ